MALASVIPQVTKLLSKKLIARHLPFEIAPRARLDISESLETIDQAETAASSGGVSYCILARINM